MEFLNLKRIYEKNKKLIDKYTSHVIQSGRYIKRVGFECVTCASGTDALNLAIAETGLAGKRVAVPSFGFQAAEEMVMLNGGTPVHVDVKHYNMDPELIPDDIDGVIAMELFGTSCEHFDIRRRIGDKPFIIDVAQNFGGSMEERMCDADIITTSFFPSKLLGCFGDGGAVFTKRKSDRMRAYKDHGRAKDDKSRRLMLRGVNSRLDEIQAAVLLARLETFDNERAMRTEVADATIEVHVDSASGYCINMMSDNRKVDIKFFNDRGIPTKIYYPTPLYPHINALYLSEHIFQLPVDPYFTVGEVETLKEALNDFANR